MRLETARSPSVPKPTADDIRAAMNDDEARGEFIILSRTAEAYMQAGGEHEPFRLEYREGDGDDHYWAPDVYTKEDVERALVWYLDDDSRWKTDFVWRKISF